MPTELDEFDMEAELAGLLDEDIAELTASCEFGGGAVETAGADTELTELGSNLAVGPAHGLEEVVMREAEATGLNTDDGEVAEGRLAEVLLGASNAASSSSHSPAPPPPPPVASEVAVEPPEAALVGPSPQGYVQKDGRTIARILRGNPKGSLAVRCFQHPSCSFLLSLSHDPGNDALLAWCVQVPPAVSGGGETGQALRERHIALVDQWRPAKKPKAKSRSKT